MKKIKMLLAGLCITVSSFLWSGSVYAEENGYESWVDEQGAYVFPITPNSAEWNTLGTAEEMREATQIPEELLKVMSTAELIIMVENYPLLCDLYAYGSLQEGYERVKAQFNGIEELLSRPDSYPELIAAYHDFVVPKVQKIDYDSILSADGYVNEMNALVQDEQFSKWILEDGKIHGSLAILEMLILDTLQQHDENADVFAEVYCAKLEEKNGSEYFDNVDAALLLNTLISEESILTEAFGIEFTPQAQGVRASTYTVYTPNGTAVSCTYDTNVSYVDASVYSSQLVTYHASLVSVASQTFNCHSFAWLQSLYPNVYQYLWLNNTTAFIADSSYKKETSPSAAGHIATWSTHSAIVTVPSSNNPYNNYIPEPYLTSKWGNGPIVAHYQSLCPYYSNAGSIQYYYR